MTSSGDAEGVSPEPRAIHARGGALLVGVRVMPSAARTEIRGVYGDRLKVAVNAPPRAGRRTPAWCRRWPAGWTCAWTT